MEELRVEFRASMALLACAVAFIGTHAAISMGEQFRLALSVPTTADKKYAMLALVALSLGGVGFSGTQYVVFQSFRLRTSDNSIVAIGYDPYMVLGSALVASFVTFLGLCLASTDECFNKSQKDIMEIFIKRTSRTYSIGEIKRLGKWHILFLVCTSSLHRVLIGGFLVGGGLCLARYMAIISVQFPGKVVYHDGMVSLAIILSVVGITILFWLFFRVLSVFPSMDILRTICSLLGLAVIACVQYIRLIYVRFIYNINEILPEGTVRSSIVIVSVLTSAVLLCFLVLAYVLSDLRAWLQRTSIQLRQADRALLAILNRHEKTFNKTPPTSSNIESNREYNRDFNRNFNKNSSTEQQQQQQPSSSSSSSYQQHRRYMNAPPEVVNYTRKYLNPNRTSEQLIIHQNNTRSIEGGGSVFTQSPAIYYDTDNAEIEKNNNTHEEDNNDINNSNNNNNNNSNNNNNNSNNNSNNSNSNCNSSNDKTYSKYPQQQQYQDLNNNNIEMCSAMEEGKSFRNNIKYSSSSGNIATMHSQFPEKEYESGIKGISLTNTTGTTTNTISGIITSGIISSGITNTLSNLSNRIHPSTTTTNTIILPPLKSTLEEGDYNNADSNNNDNSISIVRKMSTNSGLLE